MKRIHKFIFYTSILVFDFFTLIIKFKQHAAQKKISKLIYTKIIPTSFNTKTGNKITEERKIWFYRKKG